MSDQNKQDTPSTQDNTPANSPQKKHRGRWLAGVIIALVVIVIIFVALLPTLVSSSAGTRFVLGFVNGAIPGTVKVDSLSVGWFSALEVNNLTIDDPDGKQVVSVRRVYSPNGSLLSLATSSMLNIEAQVEDTQIDLQRYEDGTTNLQRTFAEPSQQPATPEPAATEPSEPMDLTADLKAYLKVTNTHIDYREPGVDPVQVDVPLIMVDARDMNAIQSKIEATVKQAADQGSLQVDAKVNNLVGSDKKIRVEQADYDVTVGINALPLDALDRIANAGGKIVAFIGPQLDASLNAKGKFEQLQLKFQAKAEHLTADGALAMTPDGMSVNEKPHAKLTITPQAFALVSPDAKLTKPAVIEATVENLKVPAPQNGKLAWGQIANTTRVTMTQLAMNVPNVGQVGLNDTELTAVTEKLADQAGVKLVTKPVVGEKSGDVHVQLTVTNLVNDQQQISPDNASAEFSAQLRSVPTAVIDELASLDQMLGNLLGDTIETTVKGQLANLKEDGTGNASLAFTSMRGQTKVTQLDAAVTIDSDQVRVKSGPLLNYQLTQQSLQSFLPADENGKPMLRLREPADVKLQIDKLTIPRKGFSVAPAGGEIGMHGSVGRMQFADVSSMENVQSFTMDKTTLQIPETALNQTITVQLASQANVNDSGSGSIDAEVKAKVPGFAPDAKALPLESARLTLKDIPAVMVEQLANLEEDQLALPAGKTVDHVELSITQVDPQQDDQRFQVNVKATDEDPSLDTDIQGTLVMNASQTSFQLDQPGTMSLYLKPEVLNKYLTTESASDGAPAEESPDWKLANTPQVKATIKRMIVRIPKGGDQPANLKTMSVALTSDLNISEMQLRSAQGEQLYAKAFNASLNADDLTQAMTLDLTGQVGRAAKGDASPTYTNIQSNTQLANYVNSEGAFDTSAAKVSTNTQMPDVPTPLLAALAQNEQIATLLGSAATFTVKGDFPGDMELDVDSQRADLNALLHVDEQRMLSLARDAKASLQINQQVATDVLGNVHPVFYDVIETESPTTLTLYRNMPDTQQPFVIPLNNMDTWDWKKDLSVHARVEVPETKMNRRGWLSQLMSGVLSSIGQKLASTLGGGEKRNTQLENKMFGETEVYTASFPYPMDIKLKDGVANASEFWLSAPDMALGFKGDVDFQRERRDFVVGVPGASFLADNPTFFVPLPTSSFMRLGIDAQTIYNIPVQGSNEANPASNVSNFINVTSQVVATAVKLNARRVGGEAGGAVGGLVSGVVSGVGKVTQGITDPEKDNPLRGLTWNTPKSVQEFMEKYADEREAMMLQERDSGTDQQNQTQQDQNQQNNQQQKQQEEDDSPAGLLRGLLGG